MSKEQGQPNTSEVESLNMARKALGRAKEMKLTAKQRLEVMDMIDEARGYEAKKELSKVINAYNLLLNYLKAINNVSSDIFLSSLGTETGKGEQVYFNFDHELELAQDFYQKQGVDWVNWPERLKVTKKQGEEMKQFIEDFGFNKMMIIPAGLADDRQKITKLHELMAQFFPGSRYNPDYQDYANRDLWEKRKGLRIIIYRSEKGLDDLYLQTRGKSAQELTDKGGLMDKLGLDGLSEAEFLVLQQQHFLEFPTDYFYMGEEIMLLGSKFMNKGWGPDMEITVSRDLEGSHAPKGLLFDARPTTFSGTNVGCPLVKSFEIKF